MTSSCTLSSSSNFQECGENPMFHLQSQWSPETHLLPLRSAWETSARNPSVSFVWRKAPRIWRDFGSALPFQTRLTQTKLVLSLSNEHGSQVKDQGRRQCSHNKYKKFPYRPKRGVSLLSGHASYNNSTVDYTLTDNCPVHTLKGKWFVAILLLSFHILVAQRYLVSVFSSAYSYYFPISIWNSSWTFSLILSILQQLQHL